MKQDLVAGNVDEKTLVECPVGIGRGGRNTWHEAESLTTLVIGSEWPRCKRSTGASSVGQVLQKVIDRGRLGIARPSDLVTDANDVADIRSTTLENDLFWHT